MMGVPFVVTLMFFPYILKQFLINAYTSKLYKGTGLSLLTDIFVNDDVWICMHALQCNKQKRTVSNNFMHHSLKKPACFFCNQMFRRELSGVWKMLPTQTSKT